MRNILLITAITFIGILNASLNNEKHLQNNENYDLFDLGVLDQEGRQRGGFINVYCLNNYVFLKDGDTGLVQFFRKQDNGSGSQPMTCDELKKNLPTDRKGNRIE